MTHALYELLAFLDDEAFAYRLDRTPPDAITITLALQDERLEVTVFEGGDIQFLRFTGDDNIGDASAAVANLYQRLQTRHKAPIM
jgi:hypothetical protein